MLHYGFGGRGRGKKIKRAATKHMHVHLTHKLTVQLPPALGEGTKRKWILLPSIRALFLGPRLLSGRPQGTKRAPKLAESPAG